MKNIKLFSTPFICLVIIAGLLTSCKKNYDNKLNINTEFGNRSIVQVFVATVNASRNYIYVNGSPVNGGFLLSTGSVFPSVNDGFNIPNGTKFFLVLDTQVRKAPVTTQVPLGFEANLQVNKKYTVFLYDTITTPKQKIVETNIVIPEDTSARIRFANFVYNPTAIPPVDVFSFNRNANIFTNINVTDVSNFIPYPSRLTTDTLYIRETGTLTNIIKISIGAGVFTEKRSYTLVYRGSQRGTRAVSLFSTR